MHVLLYSVYEYNVLRSRFKMGTVQVVRTHCNNVMIGAIASQITSLTIAYSTVSSGADQRKHQSSASLAFVRGIHRSAVNYPHKRPVKRKTCPTDDVIMASQYLPMIIFNLCSCLSSFIQNITALRKWRQTYHIEFIQTSAWYEFAINIRLIILLHIMHLNTTKRNYDIIPWANIIGAYVQTTMLWCCPFLLNEWNVQSHLLHTYSVHLI